MSLLDLLNAGYKPKENQEFGNKKKLIGDCVAQAKLEKITGKKSGKDWILLKSEVINVIPDPKGRETTVEIGDDITKMYDPLDTESMEGLLDDLFTAGISFTSGVDEDSTFQSMQGATNGKLIYYRTWAPKKKAEQMKEGQPDYWQNIKILSVNKITPENSIAQVPF